MVLLLRGSQRCHTSAAPGLLEKRKKAPACWVVTTYHNLKPPDTQKKEIISFSASLTNINTLAFFEVCEPKSLHTFQTKLYNFPDIRIFDDT